VTSDRELTVALYRLQAELLGTPGAPELHREWADGLHAVGERVAEIAARHGGTARPVVSGESYLTPPGILSDIVAAAIHAETGIETELSTSGGTSDARFLKDLCPVIDFGPPNATMHKRDEAVALDDLATLARIYRRIALAALTGGQP
jgi:succinyl-diaminopimelate desuccinylase